MSKYALLTVLAAGMISFGAASAFAGEGCTGCKGKKDKAKKSVEKPATPAPAPAPAAE